MKKLQPIRSVISHARKIVGWWEEKFPNYEVEAIVADLQVGLPLPKAKGTLKVSLKKKSKT